MVLFVKSGGESFKRLSKVYLISFSSVLRLSINQVLARLACKTALFPEPTSFFFCGLTIFELVKVFVLLVARAPEQEPVSEDLDVHGNFVEHFHVICLIVLQNSAVNISEDRHS